MEPKVLEGVCACVRVCTGGRGMGEGGKGMERAAG